MFKRCEQKITFKADAIKSRTLSHEMGGPSLWRAERKIAWMNDGMLCNLRRHLMEMKMSM